MRVSILWERAMYVLERADGVIATVGTRVKTDVAQIDVKTYSK
jgi:hypothetical protein